MPENPLYQRNIPGRVAQPASETVAILPPFSASSAHFLPHFDKI